MNILIHLIQGGVEMLCPKCHTNNPDGEKYCKNCGFQLNASRICPECGAHNKHDTKFCRECGASLSPVSSFRRDVIDNQNAPFFDKYKSLIIAAIILVLAVGAVTGIALYNNASSNTGGSDDGFSFFPLANDTNQDNIQVDDVNDTNESVNETNKTLNDTDKNKTSDKNKNNSTDKNKNATKKKTSDSNNNAIINKTNKSVESVENHSKEINSNDNNDSKNTFLDYNSDKSSKSVSYDSKSDKSSKSVSSDSKSDKSSKSVSSDTKSEESSKSDSSDFREILDNQTYLNESTDSTTADEEDDGNISDENNQSEEMSNEIDMADVPELARKVKSTGYGFSSIEFEGNDFSQSQCIAIFAEYISGSTSGSMEIPQVASASSPSGDDSSQSVSKQDYMAVARDVNAYVSSNGQIPDNAVISGDEISEISPSKILELFTEVITENFPESVDI